MQKLTITLIKTLLITIGFGDKGILPMALYEVLKLPEKDNVDLVGDITRGDVVAYFQMSRFMLDDPKLNIIDAFVKLADKKYPKDRPFSHICDVAHQLGDDRFPKPAKATYTKEDVAFLDNFDNFDRKAQLEYDYIEADEKFEQLREEYWRAQKLFDATPEDDPEHEPRFKAINELNERVSTLNKQLTGLDNERCKLLEKNKTVTFAQVQLCEQLGCVDKLKNLNACGHNIDLKKVTREQLDELSLSIVMTLLIRTVQAHIVKKCAKQYRVKSTIDSNKCDISLLPKSLLERWRNGRPTDGKFKMMFNKPATHTSVYFEYHSGSWGKALKFLLEYEIFRQLWSEESVRKFVVDTLVSAKNCNAVLKKTTIAELEQHLQIRNSDNSSYNSEVNAAIRSYLKNPGCDPKYRRTNFSEYLDGHEAKDGIQSHRQELWNIGVKIVAKKKRDEAKAKSGPMNAGMAMAAAAPRR